MTGFDTHLCLVSAQSTPNIAPALDPQFKPRRIVLATSTDMEKRARWLEAVLRRHDVVVESLAVNDPYDFYGCADTFLSWLSEQPAETALNVTGGTKVMAMAAQDVFRSDGKAVFYVNIGNDEVIFLDKRERSFVLPTRIRLGDYLAAHGYSLPRKPQKPDIEAEKRDFVARMCCESERLGMALGRLNAFAQEARGSLRSAPLETRDQDSKAFDEAIGMFAGERLVSVRDNRLVFPDEAARHFVNGGWLEYAVYCALSSISPEVGVTDYGMSVKVLAPDGKTENEIDVGLMHRNTLHIVECKTANLKITAPAAENRAADALYKLETLREIGGLRTRALLVDFRGGMSDSDLRRARQLGIQILSGRQLRNLTAELRTWLK